MQLRRAGPDDTEGIVRLLAATFPENPKNDERMVRWQYWENPTGRAFSWVWEDEGEIVCHYASVPVPMQIDGRRVRGTIGVDAATAATHRGRGLFTQLVREAVSVVGRARRRGPIPVTLFYPTPSSMLPAVTGAPHVSFDLFVASLSDRWMARRLHVPRLLTRLVEGLAFRVPSGPTADEVPTPPETVDELWSPVSEQHAYGIIRDQTWWSWRYGARPGGEYRYFVTHRDGRLVGAAVTTTRRRRETFVYILELLAADETAAGSLVRSIVEKHPGADVIALRASRDSHAAALATAAGLRRVPRWMDRNAPRVAIFEHSKEPLSLGAQRWSVVWGDMDHL